MNALVILLGLFLVSWIVANFSFLARARSVTYLTVALLTGVVFSSEGPLPLLPSLLSSLTIAARVGIVWLFFMFGNYVVQNKLWAKRRLLPIFILVSVVLVFWTYQGLDELEMSANLAYPLLVGTIMALVYHFIIPATGSFDTPARLTIAGLSVLCTGWAVGLKILEPLVGVVFGMLIGATRFDQVVKDKPLRRTERAVTVAIALCCGFFVSLNLWTVAVGILFAIFRVALVYLEVRLIKKNKKLNLFLSRIQMNPLILSACLALQMSPFKGESTVLLLSSAVWSFIASEVVLFGLLLVSEFPRPLREGSKI